MQTMPIQTEQSIREKRKETQIKIDYLNDFLSTIYKGSDAKQKVEKELLIMKREIKFIDWVLNDDLPF